MGILNKVKKAILDSDLNRPALKKERAARDASIIEATHPYKKVW